jgi:DNA-binding HxlR family transcriptional regulator
MHAVGFHGLAMLVSLDNLVSSCNHFFGQMRSFEDENCALARAVEVLGDAWTVLVVREAFFGTRRFADFETNLGIAKNVLTQRLSHLVERGVLQRVDAGQHGTRFEYELTRMGKDLVTAITALREWGDRWLLAGREPLVVHDRRTGRPVPRLRIRGEDGEPMKPADLELRPGPGATEEIKERFRRKR